MREVVEVELSSGLCLFLCCNAVVFAVKDPRSRPTAAASGLLIPLTPPCHAQAGKVAFASRSARCPRTIPVSASSIVADDPVEPNPARRRIDRKEERVETS